MSCQDLLAAEHCGLTDDGQSIAYILTLGVEPRFQRRGIAAALLTRVVAECTASPACRLVYLHVITHNEAALAFYARHHFRLLRHERRFYVIRGPLAPVPGQEYYDAYALCLYINGGRPPASVLPQVVGSALRALLHGGAGWCLSIGNWLRPDDKTDAAL